MIKALQEGLDRGWKEVSWVRPASIHLTLKFLGEVDPSKIDAIGEELKKAAEGIGPFTVSVEGVGGFPNLKTPRVIWVGIREGPELSKLHGNIDERLSLLGFEKDDRPFQPHLTLCRIRSLAEAKGLGKAAGELKTGISMDFRAASFMLFKSVLSPKGAEHTELKEIKFTDSKK